MGSLGVESRTHVEAIAQDRSPSRVLSPLDWRLIAALVEDPRASAVDLSRASGLSPKLVRRRRADLVANGHVLILPEIAYGRARGVVLFDLVLVLDGPIERAALTRIVPEGVLLRSNRSPPSGFFLCRAGSVQEIAVLEHRVSRAPGVKHAEVRFPVRREYATDRIRSWIKEENHRWQARRLTEKSSAGRL